MNHPSNVILRMATHEPAEDGRPFGVRRQAERDTALAGDGQPRLKAPSPLRFAGALHMVSQQPPVHGQLPVPIGRHGPMNRAPGCARRRAQQRPWPGDGLEVPVVPPDRALLRPGTGALRDRSRATPCLAFLVHGRWHRRRPQPLQLGHRPTSFCRFSG